MQNEPCRKKQKHGCIPVFFNSRAARGPAAVERGSRMRTLQKLTGLCLPEKTVFWLVLAVLVLMLAPMLLVAQYNVP